MRNCLDETFEEAQDKESKEYTIINPKKYNLNVCAQCTIKFLMKKDQEICFMCSVKRDELNYQRGLKDAMQWIDVKKNLPEEGQNVLALCDTSRSNGSMNIISVIYENEKFVIDHFCETWDEEPTHWMSLPEAPK